MTCLEFLDRLDDLLTGRCAGDERDAADRHARSCSRCATLLREARQASGANLAPADTLDAGDAEDLVAAVLRRTSGDAACRRAEELMCALSFGAGDGGGEQAPGAFDAQLLEAHLEHCRTCASLAEALQSAATVLPSLADVDPGAGFTARVLAATSRAAAGTLPARVGGWWRQWLARPRFAFELAYVATLLLVIVVGNPIAPLQAASERTVSLASAGIERARSAWPSVVARVEMPEQVRVLRAVTGEALAANPGLRGAIEAMLQRSTAWWSSAWTWLQGTTADLLGAVQAQWQRLQAAASAAGDKPNTGAEPARGRAR